MYNLNPCGRISNNWSFVIQTFHSLESRRQPPENLTNLLSTGTKYTKVTRPDTLIADDQLEFISVDEGVFDEDLRIYKRDWCHPLEYATPALTVDLRKVNITQTAISLESRPKGTILYFI